MAAQTWRGYLDALNVIRSLDIAPFFEFVARKYLTLVRGNIWPFERAAPENHVVGVFWVAGGNLRPDAASSVFRSAALASDAPMKSSRTQSSLIRFIAPSLWISV
jgi:hypothetical protein